MQVDQERPTQAPVTRRSLHFGIITPPVSGHLHPFGALGRELIARGHRVTVFHMPDLEARVRAENLEFVGIGSSDHPSGSLAESLAELARLQGLAALRFTINAVRKTTEMMFRDAPQAIAAAGVNVLLVDQTEPAGGTIAEHLGIPFITICNALLLTEECDVPPPFTSWGYDPNAMSRARNWLGYRLSEQVTRPVTQTVNKYRRSWSLPEHGHSEESYSKVCQISQQPEAFDFPRKHLPANFHYVGPLRRSGSNAVSEFPWERLDGRPLIYASLGTLQNRREQMFRCFAEACAALPVQLVLTHGGGLSASASLSLPGNPVVVPYAPQLEVLAKAALTLTHAGLNTVLDSLSQGVPLVAVPITYEQPAIASRIRWCGVGCVTKMAALEPFMLSRIIHKVLEDPAARMGAKRLQNAILQSGGVKKAVNLIESTCSIA